MEIFVIGSVVSRRTSRQLYCMQTLYTSHLEPFDLTMSDTPLLGRQVDRDKPTTIIVQRFVVHDLYLPI
jgi:hypothetical protein